MWSTLGFILLLSAAATLSSVQYLHFVPSNTVFNISFKTVNPSLEWKENGVAVLNVFFDTANNKCFGYPKNDDFEAFCMEEDSEVKYVLTLLNTSEHDGSIFTGDQKICEILEPSHSNLEVNCSDDRSCKVDAIFYSTKPEPSFLIKITVQDSSADLYVANTSKCINTLTDYPLLYEFNSFDLKNLTINVDWDNGVSNITLTVILVYPDVKILTYNVSTIFNLRSIGSSSTSTTSTLLQSTSSSQNRSTSSTSESSPTSSISNSSSSVTTEAFPTTPTPCDNIICDRDIIVIIIISVCVGILIVIVVIVVCCCCCPFCVCYKRNKKKRDRKSKEYVAGNMTRSRQYELNGSNYRNNGLNYQAGRSNQPIHAYQSPRAFKPSRANQPTRVDESYKHGYNNAAYFYYGANERGRDMDRRSDVTQRQTAVETM